MPGSCIFRQLYLKKKIIMKKILFSFLLVCFYQVSSSQLIYPYQDIKLEKLSDYKETEPLALSAATLLLSTAFTNKEANREGALKFLTTWMPGAKEYSFYLKGKVEAISTDNELLGLFFAAMAKYSLQNKAHATNALTVDINAAKLVIAYCDDPKNKFKLKKKYRKVLEEN